MKMKNYKLSGIGPVVALGKDGQTLSNGADRVTVSSDVYVPGGKLITEAELNAKEGDAGIFESCRVSHMSNATPAGVVEGATAYGGVTLVAGDRIFLGAQNVASQNGIYIVQSGADPVRATDANEDGEFIQYKLLGINEGTNAGTVYYYSGSSNPTIGSDALVFSKLKQGGTGDGSISTIKIADSAVTSDKIADGSVTHAKMADDSVGASEIIDASISSAHLNTSVAGEGLAGGAGAALSVNVDDQSLEIDSDALRVKALGIVTSMIAADAVTNAHIADGILAIAKTNGLQSALDSKVAIADLASTATSKGASAIGIEDAGGNITATTVEGALTEIYTSVAGILAVIGTGTFTEENYITDGETITASLDALDTQLKDITDLGTSSDTKVGTQLYSQNNFVTDGETATASIEALDIQVQQLSTAGNDYVTVPQLGTTATGDGASLVGIEDANTRFTATDVEGALDEVKALADGNALGLGAFWASVDLRQAPAAMGGGDITLSGEQTIDGTTTDASRVLVAGQTDASENGIYVTGTGAWTRAVDADADAEFTPNKTVYIEGGTSGIGHTAAYTGADSPTLGTDDIVFANKSITSIADGSVSASKLATDSVTTVKVQDGAITAAKLADDAIGTLAIADGSVTNDKLAGSINMNKISGLGGALYMKVGYEMNYFTYGDTTINVGETLPYDAIINEVKVFTQVAFDGTDPTLTIGKTGSLSELMTTTDNDLSAIGTDFSGDMASYDNTQVVATIDGGAGATAGSGIIVVQYFLT